MGPFSQSGFGSSQTSRLPLSGGGFGSTGDYNAFGTFGSSFGNYPSGLGGGLFSSTSPSLYGYSGSVGGDCPSPEVIMQMLDRGDESAALPIIQRCGDQYYTFGPFLSKIAKFKGLISGLLGGGRCNNISPEYLEIIASDGDDEVVEIFRNHCSPSIFDRLKNKFKGKLRQLGSEIRYGVGRLKRGAHELERELEHGAHELGQG